MHINVSNCLFINITFELKTLTKVLILSNLAYFLEEKCTRKPYFK
ncbi:hypothetical protein HMPREF9151_01820 [Hoylesella saccharolytica F0055]|uniref:Uncharacterized protein n=1 Tax=Hoylesella saccharolytica F0055 TaxID=1127699 RepID=L1N7D3_9BACT|nr:hypothetical protein HMPREF9151_01820 [Hoylesella saccharolytica F0055]